MTQLMLCDWCLWYIYIFFNVSIWFCGRILVERRIPNRSDFYVTVSADPIFSKPSNYSLGKKRWESLNLAVLLSSISMNLSKYLSLIRRKDWCQSLSWQRKCCYLHLLWWAFPLFFNVKTRINLGLVEPFVLMCKIWAFRTNWNWLDVISTVND